MQYNGLQALDIFRRQAGNIVLFDLILLLAMLGVAAAVWLADGRARPTATFGSGPALPLIGGLALTPLALFLIADLNIQIVQADTYYKSGLAYEGRGQWESAVVLYNEAVKIEPNEDYYYLFLGRALLEYASSGQARHRYAAGGSDRFLHRRAATDARTRACSLAIAKI